MENETFFRLNIQLELRLAVIRRKYKLLEAHAEALADAVLKYPDQAKDYAEKMQAALRELENTAPNLH